MCGCHTAPRDSVPDRWRAGQTPEEQCSLQRIRNSASGPGGRLREGTSPWSTGQWQRIRSQCPPRGAAGEERGASVETVGLPGGGWPDAAMQSDSSQDGVMAQTRKLRPRGGRTHPVTLRPPQPRTGRPPSSPVVRHRPNDGQTRETSPGPTHGFARGLNHVYFYFLILT